MPCLIWIETDEQASGTDWQEAFNFQPLRKQSHPGLLVLQAFSWITRKPAAVDKGVDTRAKTENVCNVCKMSLQRYVLLFCRNIVKDVAHRCWIYWVLMYFDCWQWTLWVYITCISKCWVILCCLIVFCIFAFLPHSWNEIPFFVHWEALCEKCYQWIVKAQEMYELWIQWTMESYEQLLL